MLQPAPPPERGDALGPLGRDLFHDPGLSANGDLSCASCHAPARGFTLPVPAPPGGRRNAPGLRSVSAQAVWGWDGRHPTLAAAVAAPLTAAHEMANRDLDSVAERLRPAYSARFRDAFAGGTVSPARIVEALAAYVSGLEQTTPYDRYRAGDEQALSSEAQQGLRLFHGKAGCFACHAGPDLTDRGFHNLGLSAFGEPAEDLGRYRVTGRPEDTGRFRTPSLRHVGESGPYMHNGHFQSLEGVVRFYAGGGGRIWARNQAEADRPLYRDAARVSPLIRPLDLSDGEVAALVAFLRAL